MSTRADISAALASVQVDWQDQHITLDCTEYRPDPSAPFAAWPEWQTDSQYSGHVSTAWHVFVVLPPGDAKSQAAALHALRWPVRVALTKVGYVGNTDMVTITADSHTTVPALRYELGTHKNPDDPIPDERSLPTIANDAHAGGPCPDGRPHAVSHGQVRPTERASSTRSRVGTQKLGMRAACEYSH